MDKNNCACGLKIAGRVLFGLPFLVFGVMHFMSAADMAAYVPAFLPVPLVLVYASGVLMIAAAVAIVFNKYADWLAGALGVMLALFVLLIHLPAFMGGDQMALGNLLKDTALAGAALYIAGICCMGNCKDGKCEM